MFNNLVVKVIFCVWFLVDVVIMFFFFCLFVKWLILLLVFLNLKDFVNCIFFNFRNIFFLVIFWFKYIDLIRGVWWINGLMFVLVFLIFFKFIICVVCNVIVLVVIIIIFFCFVNF